MFRGFLAPTPLVAAMARICRGIKASISTASANHPPQRPAGGRPGDEPAAQPLFGERSTVLPTGARLGVGLVISLIGLSALQWLVVSSAIRSLARDYVASRLGHSTTSVLA
jgi:hypothetical protein